MTRVTMGCALAVLLGACVAGGAEQAKADPARVTQARAACAQLGLNTSELPFEDCVTSLTQSAGMRDDSVRTVAAREQCMQAGLQRGTPAFANCVLDHEDTSAP